MTAAEVTTNLENKVDVAHNVRVHTCIFALSVCEAGNTNLDEALRVLKGN